MQSCAMATCKEQTSALLQPSSAVLTCLQPHALVRQQTSVLQLEVLCYLDLHAQQSVPIHAHVIRMAMSHLRYVHSNTAS